MAQQQTWERWKADWQHVFFTAALSLTTLGAVTSGGGSGSPVALRLAGPAVLAAWYVYWFVPRQRHTGPAQLPYLLGASTLWAGMAAFDAALLPVGAAALAPYCLRHTRWAVAGSAGVGVLWLWQRLAGEGGLNWTAVLGCALGMLTAIAVVAYIAVLDHEGRKRQHLYEELAAAQAEREAAERQAGILAERQRLSREIHDTLTQGFASIALQLDAALADLPGQTPAARRVGQAMRTARENLDESRRLIEALRPLPLEEARLSDAVRRLTARLREETALAAETVVTGEPTRLDPAAETELLRVVQEALTNVRRHADAGEVTVTLSYLDGLVLIDVADDGAGFDTRDTIRGLGLRTMRERAQGLGGTLTVESAPGEGTTVAVSIPVPARPPAEQDPCRAGAPAAL
ncbi:sensor histidine kinase [Streptomyces sp. NPDC006393]|uniref:sensor histidine kinase n=1 Tax=Streptomyces sp. NPDC006393 TaxID=3156763 RepID=UPI0033DA8C74